MIYISYPHIPSDALVRTSSSTFDSTYALGNLVNGERYLRGKLAAAQTTPLRIDYDLGTIASTDTTASASHFIMARSDRAITDNVDRIVVKQCSESAFGPTEAAQPTAWWKANRSTISIDGSRLIASVSDLSGNGYTLTGTGATKPTLTTAANGINGNMVMSFGGAHYLTGTATLANLFSAGAKTVLAVLYMDSFNNGGQDRFFVDSNDKLRFIDAYTGGQNVTWWLNYDGSYDTAALTGLSTSTAYVFSFKHSGGYITAYKNGVAGTPVASGDTTDLSGTINFGGKSGASYFNGDIGEFICFNTALSDADRQAWEAYLTAEWITTPVYNNADLSASTLYGPSSSDLITTFTATTATRHYWVDLDSNEASSSYEHSKHYLGATLDLGVGPSSLSIEKVFGETKATTTSGALEMIRLDEPKIRISLEWQGVSDTLANTFEEKILRQKDLNRFFLFTTSQHHLLLERRVLHVKCIEGDCSNPDGIANWNTITATFEEMIG